MMIATLSVEYTLSIKKYRAHKHLKSVADQWRALDPPLKVVKHPVSKTFLFPLNIRGLKPGGPQNTSASHDEQATLRYMVYSSLILLHMAYSPLTLLHMAATAL